MLLTNPQEEAPAGWLAFELGVLRRLKFGSVADPFAGEADLAAYLKRWGVRVSANDTRQWGYARARARVENDAERLTAEDVEAVLEEAYVPRHRLHNPALLRWFDETDAWWFDNVRKQAEQLPTPAKRALAIDLALAVGDYVRSFDGEARELRQPLSRVFRRLWDTAPAPVAGRQPGAASQRDARDFLSREPADLVFFRLPPPARRSARQSVWAWREEWVRGGDGFWDDYEASLAGRLGGRAETRQQYLGQLEELLESAARIPAWAIAYAENNFLPTEEIVETLRRQRRLGTIYTKDFSELTGSRAVIITA
jgi:hypothetical protein